MIDDGALIKSEATSPALPEIVAVGHTPEGDSFLDFQHEQSALLIGARGGDLFISAEALSFFPSHAIIPNKNIERIEIVRNSTQYTLYLVLKDDANVRIRHPIGSFSGNVTIMSDWLKNANQSIDLPKMPPGPMYGKIPVIERIAKSGVIKIMSNRFLATSSGGFYRPRWMESFVDFCIQEQFKRKIKADWDPLPDPIHSSWDKTFGYLITTDSPMGASLGDSIDVCFEFMLLDSFRSPYYSVIEIGTVNQFSLVFPRTSVPGREYIDAMKLPTPGDAKLLPWEAGIRNLRAIADKRTKQGSMQPPVTLATLAGTATDNFCKIITSNNYWNSTYLIRRNDPISLTKWLLENRESGVLVCDTPLVPYIERAALELQYTTPLETVPMSYLKPLSVGIPYDRHEIDWGTILRRALDSVIESEDPDTRSSWMETVDLLEQNSIIVNPDLRADAKS